MNHTCIRFLSLTILLFSSASSVRADTETDASGVDPETVPAEVVVEEPWDYSPYRVLIWIASHDPNINADSLREPLGEYLDRDFHAVWRTSIARRRGGADLRSSHAAARTRQR